jgi:hypothetical protein
MSYPLNRLGKATFPCIYAMLPSVGAKGGTSLELFSFHRLRQSYFYQFYVIYEGYRVVLPYCRLYRPNLYPIIKILNQ